jgi:CheY-like chemotaxis protein
MGKQELRRILYIEDEPDIQAVARLALGEVGGFDVLIAGSGQEALDRVAAYMPDLILLDVMMPGMDGPSTLRALRKLEGMADTPVVFMTAKVQSHEIEQYQAMGAVDVIPKPFDPMTLSDMVRSIWARIAS